MQRWVSGKGTRFRHWLLWQVGAWRLNESVFVVEGEIRTREG